MCICVCVCVCVLLITIEVLCAKSRDSHLVSLRWALTVSLRAMAPHNAGQRNPNNSRRRWSALPSPLPNCVQLQWIVLILQWRYTSFLCWPFCDIVSNVLNRLCQIAVLNYCKGHFLSERMLQAHHNWNLARYSMNHGVTHFLHLNSWCSRRSGFPTLVLYSHV